VLDGRGEDVDVVAPDLHAGLNVAAASMLNYEAVAARACEGVGRPFALLGWSMGGLVAMLAAHRAEPDALVLLEPSPPGEPDAAVPLEEGTYDPEEAYGPFPDGVRARRESAYARAERRRGVPVPAVPERTLVVSGDEYADARGSAIAARYGCEHLHLEGLDHWGLVRDERARAAVRDWLAQASRSTG
jgi:pimeloyl-ACP methyl ester carboxylesterase